MTTPDPDLELQHLHARLTALDSERAAVEARLELLTKPPQLTSTAAVHVAGPVTDASTPAEKLAAFGSFFAGRRDVYPIRWESAKSGRSGYSPACSNEWVRGVCNKPTIKCSECGSQAFMPVTHDLLAKHLRGRDNSKSPGEAFVAGVYPLLPDDTCWFLAADFDKEQWAADALAYVETCRLHGISAALERSRSGNGGHVWIFFAEPVPARYARQLGALLLTETMERRPEIGIDSYDRFFPSQDALPRGGFGNLIALPLQRAARDRGNSVFVDDALRPYDDQWAFLSGISRITRDELAAQVQDAEATGRVLGVRMPVDDEDASQPWLSLPSRRPRTEAFIGALPSHVDVILADDVYIDRTVLPPAMVARLIRLGAFQNPEFYRAQKMRMSTHDKPRIISCADLHPRHIALPRGCLDDVLALLESYNIEVAVEDRRECGESLSARFLGKLREEQVVAFNALAEHDTGVLAASPAFGKTVVAAALIAKRACSTLVLVHRRELLTQWVERLREFLSVEAGDVGTIAGGRKKPTGRIDVAVIQSLVRKGEVSDLVAGYGQLIVDECHHLSAASFELVARRSKAKYVVGLSATVARRDGHQPIIFMQCGPVRHRVDPRTDALRRGIAHRVVLRGTNFRLDSTDGAERISVPKIYAQLALDGDRNALIVRDVNAAFAEGRSILVLTERRDHVEILRQAFEQFTPRVVVLRGAMRPSERRAAGDQLSDSDPTPRIIVATGRFLGEGFDDSRLDTLFVAMPIAWKGTLAQYVGRLHRDHEGKTEVVVYDYADESVPVLARMAAKRRTGYRALGYVEGDLAVDDRKRVSAHDPPSLVGQLRPSE